MGPFGATSRMPKQATKGNSAYALQGLDTVFPTTHLLGLLSIAHIKLYSRALETPAAVTPSAEANVPVLFSPSNMHMEWFIFSASSNVFF